MFYITRKVNIVQYTTKTFTNDIKKKPLKDSFDSKFYNFKGYEIELC